MISSVSYEDVFLSLKVHMRYHPTYAKCQLMNTRETFLLFTCTSFTFPPLFLYTREIVRKIRRNVNNTFFFRIFHCYTKIQVLKYTLDLNNDKNPSKIKKK